jgi:hypothetical protein
MHKMRVWKEKWDITMSNPWSGGDTNSLCKQVVHHIKAMAFLASSKWVLGTYQKWNENWLGVQTGFH